MKIIEIITKYDNSAPVVNECGVDEIFKVFRMLSYDELKDKVFKTPKRTSPDDLSIDLIKTTYPYIGNKIINLANNSLETRIILDKLKISRTKNMLKTKKNLTIVDH